MAMGKLYTVVGSRLFGSKSFCWFQGWWVQVKDFMRPSPPIRRP